jgi:hypothetical protein
MNIESLSLSSTLTIDRHRPGMCANLGINHASDLILASYSPISLVTRVIEILCLSDCFTLYDLP